MKGTYPVNCFSGECGLCECCSGSHTCLPRKTTHYFEDTSEDCLKRAKDNLKIISDDLYQEKTNDYMRKLHNLVEQEKKYVQEIIPDKCSLQESVYGGPSIYTRIKGIHGAICDDMYCKMRFINSDDFAKTIMYTEIPMYTRASDDGCQLCAVCITNYRGYTTYRKQSKI